MTDPDILDRIDDTLDDYDTWNGHSPDAARWAGGPTEGEWPEPVLDSRLWDRALQVAEHHPSNPRFGLPSDFTFPQRVIVGMDPATQHVDFRDPEPPTVQARLDAFDGMTAAIQRAFDAWAQAWLPAFREIAKLLQNEPPPQPKRRTPAAERTNSARKRAGSRRTKRQARRRHGR